MMRSLPSSGGAAGAARVGSGAAARAGPLPRSRPYQPRTRPSISNPPPAAMRFRMAAPWMREEMGRTASTVKAAEGVRKLDLQRRQLTFRGQLLQVGLHLQFREAAQVGGQAAVDQRDQLGDRARAIGQRIEQ